MGQLEIYPVQYNPATKESRVYQRIKIKISFEKHDFESSAGQSSRHTSKAFDRILSQALENYPAAKSWQQKSAPLSQTQFEAVQYDFLQIGNSYKILIRGESDGVFNDDDFIEFYGAKIKSNYTKTNVYWISVGDTNGKRMLIKDGSITGSQPAGRYRRQCGYYLCKLV